MQRKLKVIVSAVLWFYTSALSSTPLDSTCPRLKRQPTFPRSTTVVSAARRHFVHLTPFLLSLSGVQAIDLPSDKIPSLLSETRIERLTPLPSSFQESSNLNPKSEKSSLRSGDTHDVSVESDLFRTLSTAKISNPAAGAQSPLSHGGTIQ